MALVLDLLVVSFYFLYCLFQFAFQFLVGIALVLTPERRIPQPPADNRYKQRHRSNTLSRIARPLKHLEEHRYQIRAFQKITRTFGILPKIVSPREYFLTRRPHGAKPQVKGTQGLAGRPNPFADRPDFELVQAETWRLCS
jgi:hypothetical protein